MDFTNEYLKEMEEKQKSNVVFSNYYFMLHKELQECNYGRFYNRSLRVRDCLNLWIWDKYKKNKLLDLQKVNRCSDRFCPNCTKFNIAKAIHNFRPSFLEMIKKGYNHYLMTITVPNVRGSVLRETIEKMNEAFSKFWRWFEQPIGKGYRGYKNRLFKMYAAIKVLEINVQKTDHDMYHPHFHVIVFIKDESIDDFEKVINGGYQRNSKSYIKYSYSDLHLMILWKMAFDNIRLTKNNYLELENSFEEYYIDLQQGNKTYPKNTWCGLYLCDIRPLEMPNGIYEVFKYTFKDKDIYSYKNFKDLFLALDGKRIRQGHGELYNLKLDIDNGEKQDLEEFIKEKESPSILIHKEINLLTTEYHDYLKISRFKAYNKNDLENIK